MARQFTGDTLVFATHNQDKVKEVRPFLDKLGIAVLSAEDINLPDVDETGTTYEENALIKAEHAAQFSGHPALADDSGFGVDALGGKPGVYSKRHFYKYGDKYKALEALQDELADTNDRGCRLTTVMCVAWPDGHHEFTRGEELGTVVWPPRGDIEKAMGYDPIFLPQGHEKTFAEMTLEEKTSMSHRTVATMKMIEQCFQQAA